ncbi:MAG: 2-polyprenylphenol 6-hydroxylase [Rhodobacteraceae bacterium]|nr:2-polyprenylphenol 6-hydroxylase [Paracoccaceae bacterium]
MRFLNDVARLVRIAATLRRNGGLDPILQAFGLSGIRRRAVLALLTPLWPLGARGAAHLPPVTRSLSALGPSYVKFGQIASTRPDVAGEKLAQDLRYLQERLPPFEDALAREMIEAELGRKIDDLFDRLDPPIAAASIAQVHPAIAKDGRRVAVKVLRPGIEAAFARDISAFYLIARTLETFRAKSRRLKPTAVVRHFEGVVSREMDLRLEAAAGSEYQDNIRGDAGIRTPDVIWSLSSKRVLTTSWVDGTPMGDLEALRARDLDLPELALKLVRHFLRCALRDGYFHADLHHGNLKIAPDGAIVAFDFGIMGRIDPWTRRTYAEILFSYLTRDYRRGAQAHFDAGYVSRTQNIDQFAQALRSIGEPIVGQRAADISMARVLEQLFDVTERFGMETRPELILLQRTMVVIEGVARSLDPNFNMWAAARPEVEQWMMENIGPQSLLRDLSETARALSRIRPLLPKLAERLVEFSEHGVQPAAVYAAPSRLGRFRAGLVLGVLSGALFAYGAMVWLMRS